MSHRDELWRGDFRGGFGGEGGVLDLINLERLLLGITQALLVKGKIQKNVWGDIGQHMRILRSEDRGTYFRCLQSGHHQARCTNPPMCYKCKKVGHMTFGCSDEKKFRV